MTSSVLNKNMESNVAQLPLADRLWDWFETYKRQLFLVLGILVLAGLVTWFILWHQEQKQIDAGNALSQVAATQLEGSGARSEVADAYLKVAKTYPNSSSGARALLLANGTLFTESKYPES